MTKFQIAETVEELETQHSTLKQRIRVLVESDDPEDTENLVLLTRQAATLATRITDAKVERERDEQQRKHKDQERARAAWPQALADCQNKLNEFLANYRAANVALGEYNILRGKLIDLAGQLAHPELGPLPQYQNAVSDLAMGDKPTKSLEGLALDMGADWRTSYPVRPMYKNLGRGA
jgi:hypothetical protein